MVNTETLTQFMRARRAVPLV